MRFPSVETLQDWRTSARDFLNREIPPDQIHWNHDQTTPSLFGDDDDVATADDNATAESGSTHHVPKAFLELASRVAAHRDPARWEILYRTLWRLTHGEKQLLSITTDDDVYRLVRMRKAVDRDVHKMKAFVRFRKVHAALDDAQAETYVAWHRPDHRIVSLAAPFFARRFKGMNWSILTPDESVRWDQESLTFGPGVPASEAPSEDELEELWKTYYASIFNPARVKIKAMKAEMPVRYWDTMPETELIPDLIRQADSRVESMIAKSEGFDETATSYFPPFDSGSPLTLSVLKQAAAACRACDLHQCASQVVFGQGPADAKVVLVGEQPGDQEDLAGQPFLGPAGRLLDTILQSIGIHRSSIYVTNVVKHFKFTQSGPRRLHKKPSSREIYACRPWMEAELAIIDPAVVVCLGSTPAQAMFGRDFRISKQRGQIRPTDWCQQTIATWHPAAILRMPDGERQAAMRDELTRDLALMAGLIEKGSR